MFRYRDLSISVFWFSDTSFEYEFYEGLVSNASFRREFSLCKSDKAIFKCSISIWQNE